MKQRHHKKNSFLYALISKAAKKKTTVIFVTMLGHVQKISHLSAREKKHQNIQDIFAWSPSIHFCKGQFGAISFNTHYTQISFPAVWQLRL